MAQKKGQQKVDKSEGQPQKVNRKRVFMALFGSFNAYIAKYSAVLEKNLLKWTNLRRNRRMAPGATIFHLKLSQMQSFTFV